MYKAHSQPAQLNEEHWKMLHEALSSTYYHKVPKIMKAMKNQPMQASKVLPSHQVNEGDQHINKILQNRDVPLRFVRIGKWTKKIEPYQRLLAFVFAFEEHKTAQ